MGNAEGSPLSEVKVRFLCETRFRLKESFLKISCMYVTQNINIPAADIHISQIFLLISSILFFVCSPWKLWITSVMGVLQSS